MASSLAAKKVEQKHLKVIIKELASHAKLALARMAAKNRKGAQKSFWKEKESCCLNCPSVKVNHKLR